MNIGQVETQVMAFVRPTATGTAVAQTVPSNFVLQNIRTWINEELHKIYRLQMWFFLEGRIPMSTVINQQTYPTALPGPILSLGDCIALSGTRLHYVEVNQGLAFYSPNGPPRAISLDPSNLQTIWIFPMSDQVYQILLTTYTALPDLSASTDTNFLTQYFADLVIACGVYITASQLQEVQLAQLWYNNYMEWIGLLSETDTEWRRANGRLSPGLAANKVLGKRTAAAYMLQAQQPAAGAQQ
jgi:hypothetical protein